MAVARSSVDGRKHEVRGEEQPHHDVTAKSVRRSESASWWS